MWKRKLFETYQELLNWLNHKETILRAQKIQIIKPECNTAYEVFYWDSWEPEENYF